MFESIGMALSVIALIGSVMLLAWALTHKSVPDPTPNRSVLRLDHRYLGKKTSVWVRYIRYTEHHVTVHFTFDGRQLKALVLIACRDEATLTEMLVTLIEYAKLQSQLEKKS